MIPEKWSAVNPGWKLACKIMYAIYGVVAASVAFLRSETKDPSVRTSWILIAPATAIVIAILTVIETGTSRESIYPDSDQRLDIDHLLGARLSDVCPEADADPRRETYEQCLGQLDRSRLFKFTIPKFDDLGDTPPDMPDDLAASSDKMQKSAAKIFAGNSGFIIGIKIPKERIAVDGAYWAKDRNGVRKLAMEKVRSRPLLTFRGMRFGTACIEGRCNIELNESTMGANTIPLVWRSLPAEENQIVWLFGLEGDRPIGLRTYEGLMISEAKNLLKTVSMYAMILVGGQIRMAQNFIALFFIALVFSLLHRSFPDYSAFAGFAAAVALWTSFAPLGVMLPWLRGAAHHAGFFYAWGNVLTMSIVLSLSLRRQKRFLLPTFLVGESLAIIGGGVIAIMAQWGEISTHWGQMSAAFVALIVLANLYLFIDQILITKSLEKSVGDFGRRSARLNFRWRLHEAWIHLSIWLILVLPMGIFAWRAVNSGLVQQFSSAILWALFPMLGVMLYFMYSKKKTRITSEPHGEALRLQQLLPKAEFETMMDQNRSGVVWVLDVAGSTGRDAKKKGLMMQGLLNQAAQDLESASSYIELPTTGGDEWRIVTGLSYATLAEDLRAKVVLLQKSYPRFLQIINDALPGSGLHAVVMALTEYTMACSAADNDRSLPVLDFRGDEADALMGFLGKPKMADSILVCGPQSVLVQALEGITIRHKITMLSPLILTKLLSVEPIASEAEIADAAKVKLKLSKTLMISDKLDLAFVHVPLECDSLRETSLFPAA